LGDDGFVSFDDVNVSAGFTEFAGNHVAGDLRADEQYTLPLHLGPQAADDGFGDVFFGNNVDGDAALFNGFLRRRADSGDSGG